MRCVQHVMLLLLAWSRCEGAWCVGLMRCVIQKLFSQNNVSEGGKNEAGIFPWCLVELLSLRPGLRNPSHRQTVTLNPATTTPPCTYMRSCVHAPLVCRLYTRSRHSPVTPNTKLTTYIKRTYAVANHVHVACPCTASTEGPLVESR